MAHISPSAHGFTDESYSDAYAKALDYADPLKHLRDEFVIPTKTDLKRETLAVPPGPYTFSMIPAYYNFISLT